MKTRKLRLRGGTRFTAYPRGSLGEEMLRREKKKSMEHLVTELGFKQQKSSDQKKAQGSAKLSNKAFGFGSIACFDKEINMDEWESMHTIGDGSCLIHSFLYLLSPTYRSHNDDTVRKQIAMDVRLSLADKAESRDEFTKDEIKDLRKSDKFLSDSVAQKLAAMFDVNLVLLVAYDDGEQMNIMRLSPGFTESKNTVVMLNTGGNVNGADTGIHFEAVLRAPKVYSFKITSLEKICFEEKKEALLNIAENNPRFNENDFGENRSDWNRNFLKQGDIYQMFLQAHSNSRFSDSPLQEQKKATSNLQNRLKDKAKTLEDKDMDPELKDTIVNDQEFTPKNAVKLGEFMRYNVVVLSYVSGKPMVTKNSHYNKDLRPLVLILHSYTKKFSILTPRDEIAFHRIQKFSPPK